MIYSQKVLKVRKHDRLHPRIERAPQFVLHLRILHSYRILLGLSSSEVAAWIEKFSKTGEIFHFRRNVLKIQTVSNNGILFLYFSRMFLSIENFPEQMFYE